MGKVRHRDVSDLRQSPAATLTLSDAAGTSTFNLYLVDPALNILDPSNSSGGGGALLLHTDASVRRHWYLDSAGSFQVLRASRRTTGLNLVQLSGPREYG